ncbi:MAG: ribonuclease III [Pseudomonadales bacterium]|nr:ribonuclease III [Pseudomonadales bacterium]
MAADLDQLQTTLSYRFNDLNLAKQALTHRSAGRSNNERLEFLGDALLDFIVGESLFANYPQASEGDLTRMRAAIVNKSALAGIAGKLSLGDFLYLGAGEVGSGGKQRESILADTLEALVAAVYLDGGIEACQQLVATLTHELVHQPEQRQRKDSKTRLQELLQAKGEALPVYRVVETSGKAHAQEFLVECRVPLLDAGQQGRGGSKRMAEQQAAQKVLDLLAEKGADG